MALILVGSGDSQAVLEVPAIPKVGDILTLKRNQIVWSRYPRHLKEDRFVVIQSEIGRAVFAYRVIPWFEIWEPEILNNGGSKCTNLSSAPNAAYLSKMMWILSQRLQTVLGMPICSAFTLGNPFLRGNLSFLLGLWKN